MPVNVDFVEAKVREMKDAINLLRELTAKSFAELTLHEKLSMRYLVIQLVEAAASICLHMLIELHGEKADGFPNCFAKLGDKGLIPKRLASRLASAARLRNLLVHRYWSINDEKVYASVKKGLKDFEDFIKLVKREVERLV